MILTVSSVDANCAVDRQKQKRLASQVVAELDNGWLIRRFSCRSFVGCLFVVIILILNSVEDQ